MIPAIVLAAGRSSRMGRPKANLSLGGDTFLTRVVRTLAEAGVGEVVVVLGHEPERIARDFARSGLEARLVENPRYASGQLSSILVGLDAVDRPDVEAALVTLVDVPLVSASTVRAVLDAYRRTEAPVVRPTRGTEHGHPLLVARSLFGALQRAEAEAGAKPIVRAHASVAGDIVIDDPGAFLDIDTPEEYEAALRTISAAR
jgi:molybdenum cofactor cytidylyltransferase